MATSQQDPFAASGGGDYINGNWIPKSMTQQQQQQAAAPAPAPTAQFAGVAPGTDPFAATGGGVQVNGMWVPKSHPLAAQAGAQPSAAAPPAGSSGYYGGSPTGPQPYNATPAAQTSFMNTVAGRMTQNVVPSADDPVIRAQTNAYNANVDRQTRNLISDQAEKLGPYATGALHGTDLMARERAGQVKGSFEADLVGRELQSRREEVQRAIDTMQAVLTEDQRAALERERMALDAELTRLGISTSASTAAAELALKDKLGTGGLNIDMMRALLQNQQFGDDLGLRVADTEAKWDNEAIRRAMGY